MRWPDSIDFEKLPQRLRAVQSALASIIVSPFTSAYYTKHMTSIRETSSLRFESASGQLDAFETGSVG